MSYCFTISNPFFLVQGLVTTTISVYITVITKDKDRSVVMATLQALNEMLKKMTLSAVCGEGHVDAIITAIRAIFLQQVNGVSFGKVGCVRELVSPHSTPHFRPY